MKRSIVLIACCVVVSMTGACSKKTADSAAPADQPAAAAAPAAAPAAAETPQPAEPKPIEITDDLVTKYMEYQKVNFALLQQYAEESRKNLESAKGDTTKTLNQISINDKMSKELDAKLKAKRQELGLGDAEFAVVKEGADAIATGRALYNQMGGDAQLAKMEAEQKAEIAKMPAEQRAAAEAQAANVTKSLRDVRDGLDLRRKYGDKSADALLRHADALAKQQWEALKLMGGKK